MEVKLRTAMAAVKTPLDFVSRPIAAILFVMILLVLILHLRTLIREHKAKHGPDPIGPDHEHSSQQG
jgi:putative tricarboxylic transport membrane protein